MSNALPRVIKGLAAMAIARITNSGEVLIATDVPASFTLSSGIEHTVTEARSPLGEKVRGNIFISQQMPELNITVGSGKDNPLFHEFIFGTEYQAQSGVTIPMTEVVFIPPGTGKWIRPAASNGQKRYGLARNAENQNISAAVLSAPSGSGSVNVPKQNVTLTLKQLGQNDTLANVTLADNEFAVDANGAMAFAANLRGQSVVLRWEESLPVIRRTANTTGFYHIVLEVLDDLNTIEVFDIPRARANLSGKNYDPSAETWELSFFITPFPGQCLPFQHYYTNLTVSC